MRTLPRCRRRDFVAGSTRVAAWWFAAVALAAEPAPPSQPPPQAGSATVPAVAAETVGPSDLDDVPVPAASLRPAKAPSDLDDVPIPAASLKPANTKPANTNTTATPVGKVGPGVQPQADEGAGGIEFAAPPVPFELVRRQMPVPEAVAPAVAAESPAGEDAELGPILDRLDSDRPEHRATGAYELGKWLGKPPSPERVRRLSAELPRRNPSLETLQRAAALLEEDQPIPARADVPVRNAADIEALLDDLDSDDFLQRSRALADLRTAAGSARWTQPLLTAIKTRLDADKLTPHRERQLTLAYEAARRARLTLADPPPAAKLPAAALQAWVEALADESNEDGKLERRTAKAERELLDALLDDAAAAVVKEAIDDRLKRPVSASAEGRLLRIRDWCLPAMVAEIWSRRESEGKVLVQQVTAQYLLVGVPWRNPDAPGGRSSHFDRVDDERAHCVDGYALLPGDYPVHVAFPHPARDGVTFFHIVNLPTPRRRMEFEARLWDEYQTDNDMARRLRDISRRTCDRLIDGKIPLTDSTVPMLMCLDGGEVSRFLSQWWLKPRNYPLSEEDVSLEGPLFFLAARTATPTALPGLLQAARKRALGKLTEARMIDFPWCAVLAVAQRHTSASTDDVLAELLPEDSPLLFGQFGDVGATAAAILLERHRLNPSDWGLETVPLDKTTQDRLDLLSPGFRVRRFVTPAARETVRTWWRDSAPARRVPAERAATETPAQPAAKSTGMVLR